MNKRRSKQVAHSKDSPSVKDRIMSAFLDVEGLHFATDELIAANARVIDAEDPFAAPVVRLLARILPLDEERAGLQLVQWPDGLIGMAQSGLTGKKRVGELVRAYKIAFGDLFAAMYPDESGEQPHDA